MMSITDDELAERRLERVRAFHLPAIMKGRPRSWPPYLVLRLMPSPNSDFSQAKLGVLAIEDATVNNTRNVVEILFEDATVIEVTPDTPFERIAPPPKMGKSREMHCQQ